MAEGMISSAQSDIDFAMEILARMEANLGISLREVVLTGDSIDTIRVHARSAIGTACRAMAEREFANDPQGLAAAEARIAELTEAANVVPTFLVSQANFDQVRDYTGDRLGDYVKSVVNSLSLIKEGESPEVVTAQIIATGLIGFGGAFAYGVIKALIAKEVLKQAVLLGVKAAGGVAAVVGVVAVIILELLFFLLHDNKKTFVGLVFNNTAMDLVVDDWRAGTGGDDKGDLYMAWGSATGFMEVHIDGDLSKPAVQLPAKSEVGGETGYIVNAGIYSASKNFGLKGAEGVFVLHPLNELTPRFALLFECPYFQDNGTNVAIDTSHVSAKSYYDRMDGSRGLDKAVEGEGYRFGARVANASGGEALGIAILDQL